VPHTHKRINAPHSIWVAHGGTYGGKKKGQLLTHLIQSGGASFKVARVVI